MAKMNRRDSLKIMGAASVAAGSFTWTACEVEEAQQKVADKYAHYRNLSEEDREMLEKQFFTDHEYETVKVLVELIIPPDDKSGGANEARVPEFIDFMMFDYNDPARQTAMRGGLKWLDMECLHRYNKSFIECTKNQQTAVLDDIAYPEQAKPEMRHGVAFFNSMRDLTASGFWSSRIGVEDIGYLGNKATNWTGPPKEALEQVGLNGEA